VGNEEVDQKMIDAALERERTREKARIMNIKHEIFTVGGMSTLFTEYRPLI
jgi:hypothetical protein